MEVHAMKQKRIIFRIIVILALFVIGGMNFPEHRASAANTAVAVAAVEYYDENVIVFNNGNSKIYFATDADAASGKWEFMNADSGVFTEIDVSWLLDSTENVIVIKGNVDDTKSRVVLKKKPTKLSITINYSGLSELDSQAKKYPTIPVTIAPLLNIMSTEGNSSDPITYDDLEWKKGDNGRWENTNTLTIGLLEKFMVKGASLYFRIRAVDDCVDVFDSTGIVKITPEPNDRRAAGIIGGIQKMAGVKYGTIYPDGTKGRRFSEEVRLKISKQIDSMVYGVDGEKFTAAIKYGKEYRVTATYADGTIGTSSKWVQVTDRAVKNISLATMANGVSPAYSVSGSAISFNGTTDAFPSMYIEVRDYATTRAAASKITEISLNAQRTLTKSIQSGQPSALVTQTTDDIYLYYFGNKYALLTIPMASATLPYEYCVVKKGDVFDVTRATWSSVTKGTAVKVLASKAVEGATIYVRQKEIKSKAATNTTAAIPYQLASTYQKVTIGYPSIPIITTASLTYVKGYPTPITITVQLNESNTTGFEDTLKSIKLGTKEIGFDPPVISVTGSSINIMTITLKSADLEALAVTSNRYLTITFANGTVDKSSVKLSIKTSAVSGTLTLSAIPGSAIGNSKVSLVSSVGPGNSWVYVVDAAAPPSYHMEDTLATGKGYAFTSGMDITVADKQYIIVYEIDATRHIIKCGSKQIITSMIKQS
jgi:hypothetical protein